MRTLLRASAVVFGFVVSVPSVSAVVLDQTGGATVSGMWATICSVLPWCNLGAAAPVFFATRIANFIFLIISGVAVCCIVYGGIKMMLQQGDDTAIAEAKKIVIAAAVGLVLAMLAYTIVGYLQQTIIPQITA